MIILKVTKNQVFTLSLEDTFFEKTKREGGQIDSQIPLPLPPAVLGLIRKNQFQSELSMGKLKKLIKFTY